MGRALGKDTKPLEEKVKILEERFSEYILPLRLSELSKRNMALKIYSEILSAEVWLCGTEEMANQLREDDPGTVAYTVPRMN